MTDVSINLDDILTEMDELGRAKFDAALERAKNRKLQERIEELTAQRAEEAKDKAPTPTPRNNGEAQRQLVDAQIMRQNGELDG